MAQDAVLKRDKRDRAGVVRSLHLPVPATSVRRPGQCRMHALPASKVASQLTSDAIFALRVQEKRLTIPQFKSFIATQGLKYIVPEFGPGIQQHDRAELAQSRRLLSLRCFKR